ncbi:MAG: heavy metal translocating P-type ATPase [Thiotrichaceae bacterium]
MHDNCFHCGLPVIEKRPPVLEVQEQLRAFCCHGCKAVCHVIVSSGNVDYYTHREGAARTFNNKELPKLLNKLKLYDNEEIQREFIRTGKSEKTDNDTTNWKEAWLILEEIRCAACMWLNERTLRKLEGVLDVQMDYTGQQARVRWDPNNIKLSEILTAITNIGYYAHPFDPSQREALNQEQKQRSVQRILFALILGMAVMQSAIGGYFFNQQDAQGNYPLWLQISRWVNVISTLLILAYPGQLFFRNAWRDLKNKSLGMDVPIVMGLSVAWLGSFYSVITGNGDVYFESIAMFVIFLLIARHIELRSRITATALLDRSAKIIPQSALLIAEDETSTKEIPVIELQQGDKIRVSPGETLPVDGRLLSAMSSFDESLLTGEALPVIHVKGDKILGGSINVEQLIEVEVLSSKTDSTLNDIHQLTQQSINYRPYYVDIAEKVAGKFVAVILFIALATFLFWSWQDSTNALSHMISVLIVTCPCALALAAPVALSLSAASLNQLHILPVRMSAIEKLSQVDTLVFDKTGTLTAGTPKVEHVLYLGSEDKDACLRVAASLEQGSQHPFAKAIITVAKEHLDEFDSFKPLPTQQLKQLSGQGIEAFLYENETRNKTRNEANNENNKKAGTLWQLGNDSFTHANATSLPEAIQTKILVWRVKGYSILYLSNDIGIQAIFCITDPLRSGIKNFLEQANSLGIKRHVILSGDHQQSVQAIANSLGISEFHGGLKPEEKLHWIKQAQSQAALSTESPQKIMMLGDGINDAPTLAAADVSLTFADATDLAKNNCDFILLEKGFDQLGNAFQLMKQTRQIIIQNLGWAVAYNVLAIPAAAMGLITPWMAAIGMSLSSLLVVMNSLRLK